jgi:putative transposase
MSRPHRIIHQDGIYHIFQRGNNLARIYESDNDKAMFLKALEATLAKYDHVLLYYVIMDNHFHLLVRAGQSSLSQFMQVLLHKYTCCYNLRSRRSGGLYDGRFCCLAVDNERYFRQIVHYLAYNPVRAELVRHPDVYRWSAHRSIIDSVPSIVDADQLLSYFGSDGSWAMQVYREWIAKDNPGVVMRADCPIVQKDEVHAYLDWIMESFPLGSLERGLMRRGECPESLRELRKSLIRQMQSLGYSAADVARYFSLDYLVVKRILVPDTNIQRVIET